jgi:hypothetical protein
MAKLYDVLTNGDETVPQSEDNFFTWAAPGIPVDADEFDFLTQGLTGVVKKAAVAATVGATSGAADGAAPTGSVELTPAVLDQLRGEDSARLYMQAENFARLVDFVPDVSSATNEQFARLNVLNNEGSLSDIYRYVLRMSQVARTELDAETKARIEKSRKLLNVTTKKKDLIDETETEVSEPSPLVQAYFEKMAAYEEAALEYNNRRIAALAASDSRAVHDWAMNANILRNRVKHAMNDWVTNGYKNDYEKIAAFIDQVMQRDMSMLKQEYRDELEKARLTGLASGSDFFFTSLTPGDFAKSKGWTKFTFSSADLQTYSSSSFSSKKWQAKAGGGFLGAFSVAGSGGKSSSSSRAEYKGGFDSAQVGVSFEIAQAQIVRPWFKQAFLLSKSWRFDQGNPEVKDEIVSDGLTPPKGLMPGYPTSVVFIRNLTLKVGKASGFGEFVSQHTSASVGGQGGISIGPFYGGGAYSRATIGGSTNRNHQQHWDGQELSVPGMQVIGFKCHILPACPSPLSTIHEWD